MKADDSAIDDFILAIRDATMRDGRGRGDDEKVSLIKTVQLLHRSLREGGYDPMPRVRQLSEETGWDMVEYLDQCLRFPAVVPRIREKDGVRRSLRCWGCRRREYPADADRFRVCDECLEYMRRSVTERMPAPGLLIFRTSTPEARCSHAGDDTFLVIYPWCLDYDVPAGGACVRCLDEELERRHLQRKAEA